MLALHLHEGINYAAGCIMQKPFRTAALDYQGCGCCSYAELNPGVHAAILVAIAAHRTGDIRRCYQVALQAILALTSETSNFGAFQLNLNVIQAISCGALGPTYTWRQLAPFVASMRTAGKRLRRWMVPVVWDAVVRRQLEEHVEPDVEDLHNM